MEGIEVGVKKLRDGANLPRYGSAYAAGADLCACITEELVIKAGQTVLVPTGIAIELPMGLVGLIYARSGLACKKGIAPANKVGVIDSDYRGPVTVVLYNHGEESQTIGHGDRIAQLVITPVLTPVYEEAQELTDTVRNQGGFGSTGN